jgi:antitoxin ParD1/3/4
MQGRAIMPSSYTLGDHFEGLIKNLVQSGRYASASEVVRDGLRLLENTEKFREIKIENLRAEIQKGLSSGPAEPLDMDEIKAAARQQRNANRDTKSHDS